MEPGQRIADKYELVRPIGAGGMGEVWAAYHAAIDRHVAIKFPAVNLAGRPEARARFLAEARVLGRLRHPNIVDVIDFGELEDVGLYLVFELLDGTSLDAHIQELGRIAPRNAVRITIELCRGLVFAHEMNVIHRDLKPANVFLHRAPGGRMRVKLLDFGISKTCSEEEHVSITGTNMVVGTPAYMSYEQIKAAPDIDARTDIWNVGIILYEMLTGLPPFEAKTYSATVAKIVAEAVPPMVTWGALVPIELEMIVQRCLSKDREQRHPTARALLEALEAVLPRLSEPPASRRLQLDSITDLPTMHPPPLVLPPSEPSPSLRLYSPCALTMEHDSNPPVANSTPAPAEHSHHRSRPPGLLLAGLGLLVAGGALATFASLVFSTPGTPATSATDLASHAPVTAIPTSTSAAEPARPVESTTPPVASSASEELTPPPPTRNSPPRSTRSRPATLVDDPGF